MNMAGDGKDRDMDINPTKVSTDVLCEFLEVAFHTILYTRDLYPQGVFQRRKKYNVPVQMCKHPEVCQYVGDLLCSLRPLLLTNRVHKVVFVILSGRGTPLERYTFEVAEPAKATDGRDAYLLRLEQSLRAFLLKLNTCDALLSPIPTDKDPSWMVQVHTTDNAVTDLQETTCIQDFTWIEAEDHQTKLKQPSLIPLKAVDSPVLKMQLYVEESTAKR